MTQTGIFTPIEEALADRAREEYEAQQRQAVMSLPSPLPTLTGLGPVEPPRTAPDSEPPPVDALADTLQFRTRLKPTAPLPERATRAYQPPTLLLPPPASKAPNAPTSVRSVLVRSEVTVVRSQPALSESQVGASAGHLEEPATAAPPAVFDDRTSGAEQAPSTNSSSPPARTKARLRTPLVAFAGSIVVTVAVLLLVLSPRHGRILVTAAGPKNAPLVRAEVLMDGRRVCSTVPCSVDEVTRGSHLLRVQAPGHEPTSDHALLVQAGDESVIHFNLAGEASSGIDVRVDPTSKLRVTVDGSARGTAPLVVPRLSPGRHTLRLDGNPSYAPFEQQLELEPAQLKRIEPKLVPLKAIIHVTPGTAALGASVEIVGGGVRHELQKLPARIEVPRDIGYRLRATRTGYRDYETEINFADAELEKVIPIHLAWAGTSEPPAEALQASSAPEPISLESAVSGTLGANSIPISKVFVDGRPVGTTPVQIPLAPGTHSVVFAHATLGRKSVNVIVTSGKTAVAAVRF